MKEECEKCIYYHFLDSAYGACKRFPPQYFSKQKGGIFKYVILDCDYPQIAFDNDVCGEFKEID